MQRFGIVKCLLVAVIFFNISNVRAAETISIYSYYFEAPYDLGDQAGLHYELASYLTKSAKGAYEFKAEFIPRKRLNRLLTGDQPSVVPYANPDWFKNLNLESAEWTSGFLYGASVIVTNAQKTITYTGPDSLNDYGFFGVLGFEYKGFTPLFETGAIEANFMQNYARVYRGISERENYFTISSLTTARYLSHRLGIQDKIAVATPYHDRFKRRFLITNHPADLKDFLEKTAAQMLNDPAWEVILKRYGLEEMLHPLN